jgi:hypothetical protein
MAAVQEATRWVSIETVGKRLGLEVGPAIVLADDCELAGLVKHDRSHMAASERGRALPHSVTLSDKGAGSWCRSRRELAPSANSASAGPSHIPNSGSFLGVFEFGKVLEGVLGRAR